MDAELWANIRRLFEVEKLSRSAIASRLMLDRSTVRRALASKEGPPAGRGRPAKSRPISLLTPFYGYLKQRLGQYPELSGAKLLLEIRKQGYGGGYTILREYLKAIRAPKPRAFLRIETLPGEFAQVDWANIGRVRIGNAHRRLSCFVMVLSFSRMMYVEFTLSQCLEDFIAAHINAFKYFGGVVRRINYDNLKTVVLARVGQEIRFHSRFMDFAGAYLFEPVPCTVRAAWEKGKVENGIKYIRSSFLAGREIESCWPQIQDQARTWLEQEANARIHGTTRERPIERFEREKTQLQALPTKDYDCSIVVSVKATDQAIVHFQTNRYSVPSRHVQKTLTLKATGQTVFIYYGSDLIATHKRCCEKYRVIEDPAHYAGLIAERKKAHAAKQTESFLALAPECGAYLKGVIASELHLSSDIGKIQEMVQLYGKAEVIEALGHALKFSAFGAPYIHNIILQRRAARNLPEPKPIVLHKKPEWTKVTVEETDLSLYDELFDPSAFKPKEQNNDQSPR